MISYAQNFEDVMLWRVFKDVKCGYYVDVGAFHPEIDSVTKWFYDQGWSGINIEPVPESFAVLQEARPRDRNVCAAAGAKASIADLTIFSDSRGLSSLCPPADSNSSLARTIVSTNVVPLKEILESCSADTIHFLKIDAEGGERDVLLGMDFQRFRPWVVLVEATEPLTSTRVSSQWQDILLSQSYESVYFDGLNEFFLAREYQQLASHFETPPNVFDNFEMAATAREREMQAALRTELAEARSAMVRERTERAQARRDVARLQHDTVVLRTQLSSAQAAVAKLSADLGELSQQLKTSREVIETIFRSRSWRWLGGIRKLNALVRSYRTSIHVARLFRR